MRTTHAVILSLAMVGALPTARALPTFDENSAVLDNAYLRWDLMAANQPFEGWGPMSAGTRRHLILGDAEMVALMDRSLPPGSTVYVNCRSMTWTEPDPARNATFFLAQDVKDDVYLLMWIGDADQDGQQDIVAYPTEDLPDVLPLYMPGDAAKPRILSEFWPGYRREVVDVDGGAIRLTTGWSQEALAGNLKIAQVSTHKGDEAVTIEIYHPGRDNQPCGLIRISDEKEENGFDRAEPATPILPPPTPTSLPTTTPTLRPTATAIATLVLQTIPEPTPEPKDPAEEALVRAQSLMDQGLYEEAVLALREVNKEHWTDLLALRAYQLTIVAYGKLGDFPGAFAPAMAIGFNFLKKPSQPVGESFEAWSRLLSIRPWECATEAEKVIAKHPTEPEKTIDARMLAAFGHLSAAWPAYNNSERLDKAEAHLRAGMAANKDPQWNAFLGYMLSYVLLFKRDIAGSDAEHQKAFETQGFHPVTFSEAYLSERILNGPEVAPAMCSPGGFVDLFSKYVEAWRLYRLGEWANSKADKVQARFYFIEASRKSWLLRLEQRVLDRIVAAGAGTELSVAERLEEPLNVVFEELSNFLGDEAVRCLKNFAVTSKDPSLVVEAIKDRIREDSPKEAKAYALWAEGQVWEGCQEKDKAMAVYGQVTSDYSDTRAVERARFSQALVYGEQGQVQAMLAAYRSVVGDTGTYDEVFQLRKNAVKAIGDHYLSAGLVDKATAWYKHVQDASMPDPTTEAP